MKPTPAAMLKAVQAQMISASMFAPTHAPFARTTKLAEMRASRTVAQETFQ